MKQTGRDMVLWQGSCMVHEIFSEKKMVMLKISHPGAEIIAHPECEHSVLRHADFIGSTAAMLNYVKGSDVSDFIVATEPGIIHQMKKSAPSKNFIPAPPTNNCACNECPHMRLNTLEKLYLAMRDKTPEITLSEDIQRAARLPIERMLEWGSISFRALS